MSDRQAERALLRRIIRDLQSRADYWLEVGEEETASGMDIAIYVLTKEFIRLGGFDA